ncbi:MAG: hypothetical protein WBF56_08565, partial [Candidatus Acidiferrales bacterium]
GSQAHGGATPKAESARLHRERPRARDGRRRERLKIALPVQVQPFDPRFADLVDVGAVTDFSRDGLFFWSCMPHYSEGMRLMIRFPFGEKILAHKKYLGTVVRLDERENGSTGVAVKFLL